MQKESAVSQLESLHKGHHLAVTEKRKDVLVTMYVGEQIFGLPVSIVRDILVPECIFNIPLAQRDVAGFINLRGRIVTVVDMRKRIGLPSEAARNGKHRLCITVEHGNELYGILVDRIGDVMELSRNIFEPVPSTLSRAWKEYCDGVYLIEGKILILLDADRFLDFDTSETGKFVIQ